MDLKERSSTTNFVRRDHRKWLCKILFIKMKKRFLKNAGDETIDARKW